MRDFDDEDASKTGLALVCSAFSVTKATHNAEAKLMFGRAFNGQILGIDKKKLLMTSLTLYDYQNENQRFQCFITIYHTSNYTRHKPLSQCDMATSRHTRCRRLLAVLMAQVTTAPFTTRRFIFLLRLVCVIRLYNVHNYKIRIAT